MRVRALPLVLAASLASVAAWAGDDVVSGRLHLVSGAVEARLVIADGWHVNAHRPKEPFLIPTVLTLDAPDGVTLGEVEYPAPIEKRMGFSDEALLLYEGALTLRAPIRSGGPSRITGRLRYQACNDTTCAPPKTLELSTDAPLAAAGAGGAEAQSIASFVERWGWAPTFGLVLLLGMGLNLTPCVYPLVSVTLAYFGGRTAGGEERKTLWLACVYVLGICITFSALGVAAALSGSLFGAALQNPLVLGGIACLMVVLALANFGVWQFRVPSALMTVAGRSGEGTMGALFMGLTMGIVGAPCIGPIVAALLLFVGAQQSVPLGLGLFFVLGLGLGIPYVALAMAAGRIRRLPRGGEWLAWVEGVFGFVLLGLALHFATPLLPGWATTVGWALVIGGAGVVLGVLRPIGGPGARLLLRTAGVIAVAYGVAGAMRPVPEAMISWVPYSDAKLAAATADGRPVFIDFQAEWCLPCREMERTTFRDRDFLRVASSYVMLKADVTEQDAEADAVMKRFEVPGVPTYLVFDAAGSEASRFVGYVHADALVPALEAAATVAERG